MSFIFLSWVLNALNIRRVYCYAAIRGRTRHQSSDLSGLKCRHKEALLHGGIMSAYPEYPTYTGKKIQLSLCDVLSPSVRHTCNRALPLPAAVLEARLS